MPTKTPRPTRRLILPASDTKDIVELYCRLKALILQAEEADPDFRAFLPLLIQQRNALDHLVRALSATVAGEAASKEYLSRALDSCRRHLYRGYFDAADWLALSFRARIIELLQDYNRESLIAEIPDYYDTIRPRLEQLNKLAAELRSRKDGDKPHTTTDMEDYLDLLRETEAHLSHVLRRIPALDMHQQLRNRRRVRGKVYSGLIGAAVLAILYSLFAGFVGAACSAVFNWVLSLF